MNNKCVYIFLDHRKPGRYVYDDLQFDFEPFYVGKGSLTRPNGHKYTINKKKTRFYNKYNKILKETNIPPNFIIIEQNLIEEEANKLETELIKKIGKIENGGTLTNITDGGDHNGGFKCKKSVIIKRTEKLKNNSEYLEKRKDNFIEKANKIHNYKYDYSLLEYKSAKTLIKIICPEHGMFEQLPTAHLNKRGCQKCGGNKKYTKEDFIEISKKIHNDKYDYSEVFFENQMKRVKIKCPIHEFFEQTPRQHMRGRGCPICGQKRK